MQTYCAKSARAVFAFVVRGGFEAGVKLVSSVNPLSYLANVGDTRSLVIHPATTHRQLTDDQKTHAGAGPDVVRVSAGIEHVADIIADFDQGVGGESA